GDAEEDAREGHAELELLEAVLLGEAAQGAALEGAADGDVALARVDEERAQDAGALGKVGGAEAVECLRAAVADNKVGFFDVGVEELKGVRAGGEEEWVGGGA